MTEPHSLHSKPNPDDDSDDGISTKPFVEQPTFGYGLWRSPIAFVPESSAPPPPRPEPTPDPNSIAARYLAIVFPNGTPQSESEAFPMCGVCGLPVKEEPRVHYLSSAHQSALPRAHTPSSIDRTRMGLKYLEKHGWDVDSRLGLGASGQGMLFPIVPKEKRNTHGLGVQVKKGGVVKTQAASKLDAGKARKMAESEKRKDARLRRMIYGDEKIEKYLGLLEG